MTTAELTAFADLELVELLKDDPELLAIADAITATTPRAVDPDATRVRARGATAYGSHRARWIVAAAVLVAAVVAAPALAFSTTLRELIGLNDTPSPAGPFLLANVTNQTIHRATPLTLPMDTVTFTLGERGKAPGVGVPPGSYFLVFLVPKKGEAKLARAYGANGHYHATVLVPPGGIKHVWIGGWLNEVPSPTRGHFWIPTVINADY